MDSQPDITITNSNAVPPHCQHRTASGRRCRMALSDPDSGLCAKHAADLHRELDQADLAAVLVGGIQEFRDALAINHTLGELYKLQARNKISPRRAAVMAYTANLLLRTLPAIARDSGLQPEKQGLVLDFSDWSEDPDGSGIRGPACYRRAVLAGHQPDPRPYAAKPEGRIMETNIPLDRPNR
jgi:hypothetical protein